MPFQKYDGVDGIDRRQQIIRGLKPGMNFGQFERIAAQSADALDAILASFAAIAVCRGGATLPDQDTEILTKEGWIAVHP